MLPDIAVGCPASSPLLVERSAGSVIALVTARKAVRSGVLWGLVFGLAIASSEISYIKVYTDPLSETPSPPPTDQTKQ